MLKFLRIFSLAALLLLTVALIVACQSPTQTSTPDTSHSTPSTGLTTVPTTSILAPQSTSTVPTPDTVAPPILSYNESLVVKEGGISLSSNAYITGFLTAVDDFHPYCYNTATLIANADIQASTDKIKGQNLMILYGNKSQNYLLASAKLFVKSDAFPYLESMMAAFANATDKKTVQVVNAYLYSSESALYNDFVTGYSIALNVLENGVTHSLASPSLTAEINGVSTTYFDWFLDNCATYGFVYTGLTGTEARTLATFRFVGVEHALAMKRYDIISLHVYNELVKLGPIAVTDPHTGYTWTITHYPADTAADQTVIPLPVGTIYTVSGNNIDGFLVATRASD